MTVLAAASLLTGALNLFATLFTIGMWLAYSTSKKATPIKEMKFLAGSAKAYYIVELVAIICLAVAGIILIFSAPSVMANEAIVNEAFEEVLDEIEIFGREYEEMFREFEFWAAENLEITLAMFVGVVMIALGISFLLSAAISLVINILFIRKLANRLKECSQALEERREYDDSIFRLKGWFMTFGIINAVIGGLTLLSGNVFAAVGSVAGAVAYIALAKSFAVEPEEETQETVSEPTL